MRPPLPRPGSPPPSAGPGGAGAWGQPGHLALVALVINPSPAPGLCVPRPAPLVVSAACSRGVARPQRRAGPRLGGSGRPSGWGVG